MFARLTPAVFVLIYSTGWVVAEYATPHADPLAFLAVRFVCALALLIPLALALGSRWPRTTAGWAGGLLNGVLYHGVYLGGVWWAIAHGVPPGVSALIAALQPLLTAAVAGPLLGERLSARRWLGVALGMAGVAAIVAPNLAGGGVGELALPLAVNVLAMLGITAATLQQKRWLGDADLRTLAPTQYLGALLVTVPMIALVGEFRFDPTPEALMALAWSVLALSIGAITLMLAMIERGEVSRVATLLYLVPPVAALEAYVLFGETFTALQIAGMALAALGVVLANGSSRTVSAEGCIAAKPSDAEDTPSTSRRPA